MKIRYASLCLKRIILTRAECSLSRLKGKSSYKREGGGKKGEAEVEAKRRMYHSEKSEKQSRCAVACSWSPSWSRVGRISFPDVCRVSFFPFPFFSFFFFLSHDFRVRYFIARISHRIEFEDYDMNLASECFTGHNFLINSTCLFSFSFLFPSNLF